MCAAMGSPYEVSGTVHLPQTLAAGCCMTICATAGRSLTAIRLENFPRSVAYRKTR